jgi:hypothetical protein
MQKDKTRQGPRRPAVARHFTPQRPGKKRRRLVQWFRRGVALDQIDLWFSLWVGGILARYVVVARSSAEPPNAHTVGDVAAASQRVVGCHHVQVKLL